MARILFFFFLLASRGFAQSPIVGLLTTNGANLVAEASKTVVPEPIRPVKARTLDDGTISWEQPEDKFMTVYNGRCGETAAANIVSMLSYMLSPVTVSKKIFDATPGTLPSTLLGFLNREAPGSWKYGTAKREKALATLRYLLTAGTFKAKNERSPVAVLVRESEFALHWQTVVDIDESYVYVNQFGSQSVYSHGYFLDKWGFVDTRHEQWGGGAVVRWACCHPYSVIYQPN